MMRAGLKNFYTTTGHKPLSIIYFRPGTNEGELGRVTAIELEMIRAACLALESDYR